MKAIHHLAGALALAVVLGCRSEEPSSGPASSRDQPPPRLTPADFDRAATEFALKVKELGARGWPPRTHVDSTGKPRVVVADIFNSASDHLDVDDLKRRVARALTGASALKVVDREAEAAEQAERERRSMESDSDQQLEELGTEAPTAFVVSGRVEEPQPGVLVISLALTSTIDSSIPVATETRIDTTARD